MHKEISIGIFLSFVLFCIYAYTAASFQTGIGDASEYTVIGYTLGVAHAPGYPLYILFIYLFEHLIPFGTIAYRASLTSAFFDSITIFFFYLISLDLLRNIKLRGIEERVKKKKYKLHYYFNEDCSHPKLTIGIAVLASLMLGLSFSFWLYSNIAEVFALNNLFVILLVFLTIKFTIIAYKSRYEPIQIIHDHYDFKLRDASKQLVFLLVLIDSIAALGLSHLQTIIIIYPVILLYIIYILFKCGYKSLIFSVKRIFLGVFLFVCIFLLPFFMMLGFNQLHTSVSWKINPGLDGFVQYITRQNYSLQGQSGAQNPYFHAVDVGQSISGLPMYISYIQNDFTGIPIIFALLGLLFLLLRNRKLFLYIGGLVGVSTISFALYLLLPQIDASTSDNALFQFMGIVQRQFIMGNILFALLIPLGILTLFNVLAFISFREKEDTKQGVIIHYLPQGMKLTAGIVLFLCILCIGYEWKMNFNEVNLHTFSYFHEYAQASLTSEHKGSVLICFSDISCYSDLYEQIINHTRPDITIVTFTYDIRQYYLDHRPDLQKFYYSTGPYYIGDILSWNIFKGRNVYVADVPDEYVNFLGLDGEAFYLAPHGYVQQVVKQVPPIQPRYAFTVSNNYMLFMRNIIEEKQANNYWFRAFIGFFANAVNVSAYLSWEDGHINQALSYLAQGYSINIYEPFNTYQSAAKTYIQKNPLYRVGQTIPDSNTFEQLAIQNPDNKAAELLYAMRGTFENPLDITARLTLADAYVSDKSFWTLAREEYLNVLRLDPGNIHARQGLSELDQLSN